MDKLSTIFCLNNFVSPYSLHILYWGALAGNVYGAAWLFLHDNWAWIPATTFGFLAIRLVFESFILRFKTFEQLKKLSEAKQ